jgi:hypothetical protein
VKRAFCEPCKDQFNLEMSGIVSRCTMSKLKKLPQDDFHENPYVLPEMRYIISNYIDIDDPLRILKCAILFICSVYTSSCVISSY